MPIPLNPGPEGAPAGPALPAAPGPSAPQQVQVESIVRPALAVSLPSWDLLPPHQVLAFRRRS